MSDQVRCTPTSSIGELFGSYVHPLHGNPYSSHHIYHLAFSPMIVLIDVSLSHLFFLPPPPYSLFAILSVNSRAYAHPLHECSKYRKEVDQIDLYLASGLGRSQDKIPKKTKCETLLDCVLNKKTLFIVFPIPLLARKYHLE